VGVISGLIDMMKVDEGDNKDDESDVNGNDHNEDEEYPITSP
jgi:hypothetical protein